MSRRAGMWPTELSDEASFIALTPSAQWLLRGLWLHPELNTAGFLPLQVSAWSKWSTHGNVATVQSALDELVDARWVVVDGYTEEVWLRHFIRWDTSRKPNMYVSALKAAQAARSPILRLAVWQELQDGIHPPVLREDAGKPGWFEQQVRLRDEAYQSLHSRMVREGLLNGSRTVAEPPGGSASARVVEEVAQSEPLWGKATLSPEQRQIVVELNGRPRK